jgi:DnaJ-class molecular chaperone
VREPAACPACGGEGSWRHTFDDGGARPGVTAVVTCADCDGTGYVRDCEHGYFAAGGTAYCPACVDGGDRA